MHSRAILTLELVAEALTQGKLTDTPRAALIEVINAMRVADGQDAVESLCDRLRVAVLALEENRVDDAAMIASSVLVTLKEREPERNPGPLQ